MKMIAQRGFRYGNRSLKVGDEFTVLDGSHARLLTAMGRARQVEEPPKRRQYRRRDMEAAE
jgi:hypothetical protein